MFDLRNMPYGAKVVLWTQGALERLVDLGLLSGPRELTPRGVSVWDQLDAEWRPDDVELAEAIRSCPEMPRANWDAVIRLLRQYRDQREDLEEAAHRVKGGDQ